MTVPVLIRSFERPVLLHQLLSDLEREGADKVFVFDDHSQTNMRLPREHCKRLGWTFVSMPERFGKKNSWKLWNEMLRFAKRKLKNDLFVFLDDDMRLCRDFFRLVDELWTSVDGPKAASITLMVDTREKRPCWTNFKPIQDGSLCRTQWVDGPFAIHRRALEQLDWHVQHIAPGRWSSNPNMSTGVGQQMSCRLHSAGFYMYRSRDSLVNHVGTNSKLNPEERRRRPLRSLRFLGEKGKKRKMPRVEASLATIPKRGGSLRKVIGRLLPQVSVLRIYLNGHKTIPSFLRNDKIVVATSKEHGDRGDAGKFFWSAEAQGFQLICDDDILYPRNYAARMVDVIESYERKAVVGVHGVKFANRLVSYYRSRQSIHFTNGTPRDRRVHLVGTGTLAYHVDTVRVKPEDFELPNMADIWFGLLCQQQKVPVVAIRRKQGWLQALPVGGSIYARHRRADNQQTEAVRRAWPWQLHDL